MAETKIYVPRKLVKKPSRFYVPKERIGILGGCFDPPTLGCLQMAIEAINLGHIDEVWLVPCGDREDKKLKATSEHRMAMLKLVVEEFTLKEFPIKADDSEIKFGTCIPTYELMKAFGDAYEQFEFFFMMGSDLLVELDKWDFSDKLKEEIEFLIFARPETKLIEDILPKKYIIINTTFVAFNNDLIHKRISASSKEEPLIHTSFGKAPEIDPSIPQFSNEKFKQSNKERKKIQDEHLGLYGIVPNCVIDYIKKNKLFKD